MAGTGPELGGGGCCAAGGSDVLLEAKVVSSCGDTSFCSQGESPFTGLDGVGGARLGVSLGCGSLSPAVSSTAT